MEFNMKEVLQREMEKYTTNVVKEAVKALSIEYGFKAEEALEKMNLNEVRVGMKEKVEKVEKVKKIGGEGALPPPRIPLPFTGEIKEEWCKAMKQNHGLYSQCTSTAIPEGELCKTCQNQADKKGKPTCGYIRERQVGNLMEYKDEKGKKVQHYGVVLKKLKIAQADAEAEATKYGMVIPAEQYDIPEKSRGRPKKDQEGGDEADKKRGRPKKEKKVVSGSAADDIVAKLISEANKTKSANAADALLANLVAAAQAVQATPAPAPAPAQAPAEAVEETAVEETAAQKCDCGDSECDDSECDDSECEDEEKLAEQAEQKKLAQVAEQEKLAQEKIAVESKKAQQELEKAEKKAQQEAEKKEKKAQQEAEKKEKAEQAKVAKKAQQEQEKAEKKAQQEQEKAAKKAQQEQEKAEKKALQEQEKAAKKALNGGKGAAPPQEQEKAAKKALNGGKAAAPPKKAPEPTPEPTPELEHEEEESSHGAPPEEEANISVKKFEFEGRVYLRSGDDVLYDIKTQEPVGMWNTEENCIDEIEEDEE